MGRPGRGSSRSSGGGGGGHRRSTSGSGHRVGGSSGRPRGSSSYRSTSRSSSFGGTSLGGGSRHTSYRHYGNTYYGGSGSSSSGSRLGTIIISIIVLLIAIWIVMSALGTSGDIPDSTVNRKKLSGSGFSTECIVDDDKWFDNVAGTESKLKSFYSKTGVQPYIVINSYNSELLTDSEKDAYAHEYYDKNIGVDNGFMYMYFPESNPDDVGYMYCVVGVGAGVVMDAEAQSIFWAYIDYYWYQDMSSDDMFISVFNDTADRIMSKTRTKADIIIIMIVVIFIIAMCILCLKMYKAKTKRMHQKAEDTERILNADISDIHSEADELIDKYSE